MGSPALELEDVTVWRGEQKVFDGLSLRVESGERVAILGPNGAGKSTLLALISGDVHPVADQGSSRLFGEECWSLYDLRERQVTWCLPGYMVLMGSRVGRPSPERKSAGPGRP